MSQCHEMLHCNVICIHWYIYSLMSELSKQKKKMNVMLLWCECWLTCKCSENCPKAKRPALRTTWLESERLWHTVCSIDDSILTRIETKGEYFQILKTVNSQPPEQPYQRTYVLQEINDFSVNWTYLVRMWSAHPSASTARHMRPPFLW